MVVTPLRETFERRVELHIIYRRLAFVTHEKRSAEKQKLAFFYLSQLLFERVWRGDGDLGLYRGKTRSCETKGEPAREVKNLKGPAPRGPHAFSQVFVGFNRRINQS